MHITVCMALDDWSLSSGTSAFNWKEIFATTWLQAWHLPNFLSSWFPVFLISCLPESLSSFQFPAFLLALCICLFLVCLPFFYLYCATLSKEDFQFRVNEEDGDKGFDRELKREVAMFIIQPSPQFTPVLKWIHERTNSLRFLGIILLRIEVSVWIY